MGHARVQAMVRAGEGAGDQCSELEEDWPLSKGPIPKLTEEAAAYALEISGERIAGAVTCIMGLLMCNSSAFRFDVIVEAIRLSSGVHIKVSVWSVDLGLEA